ncbi:hypothetical protein GPECTOR_60g718 [Gonium pectorale]|uniref:NAD(P)H dehydrogenase (quinone) n=1 Tax=Gonium pectorale TaxID=33097 RepID=A0A150G540_GONPE|nr:hypothetical protein GPECTOR_60g718 [Gonium pectorale]|eukprot:KXZ44941.1 hypothetical protein GPECTOR_60g718 [Gonium pectorale]
MGNMCSSPAADEPVAKTVQPASAETSAKEDAKPAPADAPAPANGADVADAKDVPTPAKATEVDEAAAATPAPAEVQASTTVVEEAPKAKKLRVYLIYYSTYGHIYKLAQTYKEALETVPDVEVSLFQVRETLSKEVLEKMHAAPKPDDVPVIDTHTLPDADAFVFGFPTRFGMMAAQMKAFFDTTGALWQQGALFGKPASMFTSTATQGGGQETTILTAVSQLAHHGMIYVPTGYAAGGVMFGVQEPKGGSPWGAGTLAGPDGSRQPSEEELEAVRVQAKLFGAVAKKLAA